MRQCLETNNDFPKLYYNRDSANSVRYLRSSFFKDSNSSIILALPLYYLFYLIYQITF